MYKNKMNLSKIRRIYILGDLHLGIKNSSLEWAAIQSDFLINHFIKKLDESGFDAERDILVQVGDWNHVRESTNVRINQMSIEIAAALCDKFKRGVYVILGNHDVYYKDRTDTHSLKGYDLMFKNFYIFQEPKLIKVNSHKILLLPWNEDHLELKNQIKLFSPDLVFCHADFKGFNLNSITKLEHGLDLLEINSVKHIYSGHIHIRQAKGNVTYVGTPYEMDRGDRGNTKGFYYIDLSENEIVEQFIENTNSPKHLKFDLYDLLKLSLDEIAEAFKGNFIDIMIDSEVSSKFPLTQFIELIKEANHRKVEFFSYSNTSTETKPSSELDSNYEYNIFTALNEKLAELSLPSYRMEQLSQKFKELYTYLKNTKSYE
jgi:DNA repair exonuclease SbcCD nuclease subunit